MKITAVGMRWLYGKRKYLFVLIPLLAFLCVFVYQRITIYQKIPSQEWRSQKIELLLEDQSGVSPGFFLDDVKSGINDEYTRKSAYLVFQRYVASGNIYALYDYVNSHVELAFLREAEFLHPESFKKVEEKKLPFHHTDEGMYVFLSYLEVLERSGYGSESLLASLTYRYAQMAYYKRMINEDKERGESLDYPDYTMDAREYDIRKSVFFAEKLDDWVGVMVDDGAQEKAVSRDSLKSMVQYATALRYLESLGVDFISAKKSDEIFSYVLTYSYKFVPDMYPDTSLRNAATLLLAPSSDPFEIRNAVFPFLDYRVADIGLIPVVGQILRSRVEAEHVRYEDLSVYSKKTITDLAEKVPEFKEWLMLNGWGESDF